eukprot:2712499-Rhodomonas_salina.4
MPDSAYPDPGLEGRGAVRLLVCGQVCVKFNGFLRLQPVDLPLPEIQHQRAGVGHGVRAVCPGSEIARDQDQHQYHHTTGLALP